MLMVYLCGALITAVAAIGGSIRFSAPQTAETPLTRVAVAVLAGAIWPVLVVGAVQVLGISLLTRWRRAATTARADAFPRAGDSALVRAMA
jgi:hypothetical protein